MQMFCLSQQASAINFKKRAYAHTFDGVTHNCGFHINIKSKENIDTKQLIPSQAGNIKDN